LDGRELALALDPLMGLAEAALGPAESLVVADGFIAPGGTGLVGSAWEGAAACR